MNTTDGIENGACVKGGKIEIKKKNPEKKEVQNIILKNSQPGIEPRTLER